jgi:hypothetical protein
VLSASDAYITLTNLGSAWNDFLKMYEPTPPEINPAEAVYVQLVRGRILALGSKPEVQWLLLVSSDAPGYGPLAETGFNAPSLPSWFDQLPPPSTQSRYIP